MYGAPYDTMRRMIANTDSIQQRLALLATLLTWEGRISNARLREIFGISSVRASEWIRELRDAKPNWLMHDTKTKSFIATPALYTAERRSIRAASPIAAMALSGYLNLVGLPSAPTESVSPLWAAFPDVSEPKPELFAALLDAIRTKRTVSLTYRSMAEPAPHQRIIHPHSLVKTGRRWHVRAYSVESAGFRDYTLGRIVSAKVLPIPAEYGPEDDVAWATMVHVRLMAHPLLTIEQQEVIRFEYFNSTAARVDACRGALVPYFIQDVRAATSPEAQCPPDYQLVVENIEEISKWIFPK